MTILCVGSQLSEANTIFYWHTCSVFASL